MVLSRKSFTTICVFGRRLGVDFVDVDVLDPALSPERRAQAQRPLFAHSREAIYFRLAAEPRAGLRRRAEGGIFWCSRGSAPGVTRNDTVSTPPTQTGQGATSKQTQKTCQQAARSCLYRVLTNHRMLSNQTFYKSELLALVTAAENASLTSLVFCLLDNQSVVLGSHNRSITIRARCKRPARELCNRFFAAISKTRPSLPSGNHMHPRQYKARHVCPPTTVTNSK